MNVREQTSHIFKEEVSHILIIEKCFLYALKNVIETEITDYIQRAVLCLEVRICRLLDNASELIIQGSYPESLILLRAAYESVLTADFLQTSEMYAKKWLAGKKYEQKYIRNKLDITNKVYKFLSGSFAHPNIESICWYMEKLEDKFGFKLGRHFDKRGFWQSYTLYIILSLYSFKILNKVFTKILYNNEDYLKCFNYLQKIFSQIEESPKYD
ncbi:MAG: DUF5677 domain-containing protein [Candidatus Hodarchaeota archaeon]